MRAVEEALKLRERGLLPVPLRPRSKVPAVQNWRNYEPTDEHLARDLKSAKANLGVLAGLAGLVDVDLDHPIALRLAGVFLPWTRMVHGRPSRRASHRFFRTSALLETRRFADPVTKMVLAELRGDGAQTMVPPSTHPSGEVLTWDRDGDPAEVDPGTLVTAVKQLAAASLLAIHWPTAGSRHDTALALAGVLARGGWTASDVEHLIRTVAEAADDDEAGDRVACVGTTFAQLTAGKPVLGAPALAAQLGEPVVRKAAEWLRLSWQSSSEPAELARPSGRLVGDLVSNVEPEQVHWLWEGYLPRGKVSILDGDPGLGKSMLCCDLAASITTGRPIGGSGSSRAPAGVVIVSCEDGATDTVRPRLEVAGADLTRAYHLRAIREPNGSERLPIIPLDLDDIEEAVRLHGAELLIIDPLTGYLGKSTNTWKDQDIRRALAPLAMLAERLGCAVLVVRHLTKGDHARAIQAGGGSMGIVGLARVGMLVDHDPDDPSKRLLAITKCNVGPEARTRRFEIEQVEYRGDTTWTVGRIRWLGQSERSADDLVHLRSKDTRPAIPSRREEAADFLLDLLEKGPVAFNTVKDRADAVGISSPTLRRAKSYLGVCSRHRSVFEARGIPLPDSEDARFWCLPSIIAPRKPDEDSHVNDRGEEVGPSGELAASAVAMPSSSAVILLGEPETVELDPESELPPPWRARGPR